ncbi:hypothetical protein PR002_g24598 [Phytophthora rubi]|uniref:Reverse transcriptase domain-containing protein n=1 Tax=Phytophthora rubi TaxID=129364 RepID=A0A6A3IEC9_9STRA|nr:hypothetical protein PR002_g24598 [Phytophthora rubi]
MTEGRTKIKVTLAGSLVYFFHAWVGTLSGQDAILGMDFMVPAGIRLDLAEGTLCLPDEVRIQLSGRRPLYNGKVIPISVDRSLAILVGQSEEIPIRSGSIERQTLWATRGKHGVPTVVRGLGRRQYMRITNLGDRTLYLNPHDRIRMWLPGDTIPRLGGYVTVGSRRYAEWQDLAFQATTDLPDDGPGEKSTEPMVDRPQYATPTRILARSKENHRPVISQVVASTPPKLVPNEGTLEVEPIVTVEGPSLVETKEKPEAEAPIRALSSDDSSPIETAVQDRTDATPAETPMEPEPPETEPPEPPQGEPVAHTTEEVTIEDIQVGNPADNSPEEIERLRQIIWKRCHLLMGKGNALPPAARGVVCDIDVGGATPVAQRCRRVAPQFREKLSDLIKGLLSAKMISPSTSPWASPIVIIIKKNGVDIRLCIDYRVVNGLTQLMVYPMPLVNDLLEDLDKVLWYCSLDMASGFWVVSMTERAPLISAFITPFGLFEWNRVPFGLKNAPQIYQRLIDNALYGYLKISADVANDSEPRDVFLTGEAETEQKSSVLGRRSYIDDILVTADSWDTLCNKVDRLLEVCDKWNLSISVVKSFWGLRKVDYLGHQVSMDGLEAHPKDLQALADLPFPSTLRAMQSFLGSLNYYSRFIEDFAIYASVLYELRESDFHEITRKKPKESVVEKTNSDDREETPAGEDRWTRAERAFTVLKTKIAATPVLRHFDPDRPPVVVVYASKWAVSAALMQEHDGVYWPVTFTSRTLKSNEINYGIVDKEVLALLRILEVCYMLLVTRTIKVLTRYSTLGWLMQSKGFHGRLGRWTALLSPWTLEIVKCIKGEDEILGTRAATITPRAKVDEALIEIAPQKQPRQVIAMPLPTVEPEEKLLVVSFDGSARVKRGGGAYSAIVWQLPQWKVVFAVSEYMAELTVNEAEYRGMMLCLDLVAPLDRGRLIICGDSNLVIRQMRGEIECKAPGLKLLRSKAMEKLRSWPDHEYLHMK